MESLTLINQDDVLVYLVDQLYRLHKNDVVDSYLPHS